MRSVILAVAGLIVSSICVSEINAQPGPNPGQQPGANPGQQPGANPGQQPGANPSQQPFAAGMPLGVNVQGQFTPMSSNVKVFGSFRHAESCTVDATRDLLVIMNRGTAQNNEVQNDGFV